MDSIMEVMKKTKSGIEYETKAMTVKRRAEMNDFAFQRDMEGMPQKFFSFIVAALHGGLKSVNGVEITEKNFDEELMRLTDNDILEIGSAIILETNPTKKKED